jgi:hypothetical protein
MAARSRAGPAFVDACLLACLLIFFRGTEQFWKRYPGISLCAKSERKIRCEIYTITPADLAIMSSAMSLVNNYCCGTSIPVSIHSSFPSDGLERWIKVFESSLLQERRSCRQHCTCPQPQSIFLPEYHNNNPVRVGHILITSEPAQNISEWGGHPTCYQKLFR